MILVAPTAFKGTYDAAAVAAAAARGATAYEQLDIRIHPVSDGGPGLIDALLASDWHSLPDRIVAGPLGAPTRGRLVARGDEVVIESADACGLALVPSDQRDPMRATSFGVGELIAHASRPRARIYVGLGGSATMDAGLGMAQALGWRLLDARGREVERGGRGMLQLAHIEPNQHEIAQVNALADVRNPLFGPNGAAHVFGAQKGATRSQIEQLDAGFQGMAEIVRRDLGVDIADADGAGAAGGLGFGLMAFAAAGLLSGSAWVLAQTGLDDELAHAHVVITGEGSFDAQSSMGKITGELISRAGARRIPVLLLAGRIEGALPPHVTAAGAGTHLDLADIEQLVREALPRLLSV